MNPTQDLQKISLQLEAEGAEATVRWALDTFHPEVVMASSFGLEDVALIHMASVHRQDARIFYLDTDLLFKETYQTRDRLQEKYGMEFIRVRASLTLMEQTAVHGAELWRRAPDACCNIRKVVPLGSFLNGEKAWITGIRREQSPARKNAQVVEWDDKFSLVKVNPLAAWTHDDVRAYIRENDVPYNLLHDEGYPSIGCIPCTRAVAAGEDPRAGRWSGFDKTECGLHK